jgi:hypothetical protein
MDYAEMNLGSWGSQLARFRNLLRPMGSDALGQPDEIVESARSGESAQTLISALSGRLPAVVFEGYADWYAYADEWVLRNLGQVLTAGDEDRILSGLDQGTPDALLEVLGYVAGQLDAWREAAGAGHVSGAEPGMLEGTANTENWAASRTPGTFYYTYYGDSYLYSDLAQADVSEWETLPVREQLATDKAEPWGGSGWFVTPAGEPGLYGGSFVYAPDLHGPWMTHEQAEAAMAARPAEAAEPSAGS